MTERWRRTSVLVGAVAWLLASFEINMGDTERLLLLAPLVLAPLLLAVLAAAAETDGRIAAHLPHGVPSADSADRLGRAIELVGRATVFSCVPAGLSVVVAVQARPGIVAVSASLPWLVVAALLTVRGALAAARRRGVGQGRLGAFVVDLAPVFGLAGAGSLALWAAGSSLGRLSSGDLLWAAAHLHHAGLVLAAVAGVVALRRPGPVSAVAAVGVACGVPLLLAGRVAGGPWAPRAGMVLAAAACVVAGLLVAEARDRRVEPRGWRLLQCGSALGLGTGAALVIVDAVSRETGSPALAPATVGAVHGTATAVGFGLLGALAWSDTRDDPRDLAGTTGWRRARRGRRSRQTGQR